MGTRGEGGGGADALCFAMYKGPDANMGQGINKYKSCSLCCVDLTIITLIMHLLIHNEMLDQCPVMYHSLLQFHVYSVPYLYLLHNFMNNLLTIIHS